MYGVKGQDYIAGSATNKFTSFCFTSMGSAIPEMQLFKTLTTKIQRQGYRQGQRNGYIWGQVFNQYVHFLFCGNQIILS